MLPMAGPDRGQAVDIPISKAKSFVEGLDHPECITTGPDGIFYAGGEAGQIYRIAQNGSKVETIANTGGFILGVAISPDGENLYACDLAKKSIWKLEIYSRTLSLFADKVAGKPINIPNHLAFLPDGSLFVTDSGKFREINGRILKFDAAGKGSVWHEGPFNFANGIALGPGGDAVYLCCSWLPGVERIELRADGSPGKREVYAKLPESLPDGLAFDAAGNLYVSCYTPSRIYKITPAREVSILIDDWEAHTLSSPTNITFGGPKFDQLFAANLSRWHITRIEINTPGLPLACHRKSTVVREPR